MKIAAFAVISMTFSALPAAAWERITTEAELLNQVAGRTLVNSEGYSWVYQPDGQISGTWDGMTVVGRWEWHQGLFCRNVRVGGRETGTDCQVKEIRGNQLRYTRDQGRGDTEVLTIQ